MKKQKFKIPVFTIKQRKGILALACIIIAIQLGYYWYLTKQSNVISQLSNENLKWLNQQIKLDSIQQADSSAIIKIYPFNPNFITDFKGYQLGMSVDEIDRLLHFRAKNKYVNSASEFQKVTLISDSLLQAIQPYFKFPDWTQNKKSVTSNSSISQTKFISNKLEILVKPELNKANFNDLQVVSGIGEVLSQRIIDERNKYNGFVAWEQLNTIYGLKPETIRNIQKHFILTDFSEIIKVDINNASIQEITVVPYLKYTIAKEIVIYRSKYGDFKTIDDLASVSNFPSEKSTIIQHYLIFK
jgi:DNA uptake protein ComE-like DNA-binding protein